ncbi:MAG: restriction endonuclease subunit S [Bacteroidetes bacterium]|nr:restriction endonuclease subunit S [Bacteroidota bacterium]
MQNIGKGYFIDKDIKYISEAKAEELKYHSFVAGDIALAKLGIPVGKTCIIPNEFSNGIIVADVVRIRPDKSIVDFKFLEYFLNTDVSVAQLSGNISGATRPRVNLSDVRDIELNLPPLPEQQRIVAILDEAFAAIAKAKANAEQNLQNAKELFEGYLQGVFEKKGEGWEEKTIDKVCSEIFAGGDAPKDNYSEEKTEKYTIPIYANAVKNRGLYGYTDFARVTKPSITIAARGSGTGHTELRSEAYSPIVRLIVLIPNTEIVTLEFLKYKIDTLDILRSGSAIPQLTVPMIKEYKIPILTLEAQQAIVQKLDALNAETKKLETIYQQKINDLEELKKSVLQKAFAGELKSVGVELKTAG